MNRLNLEYTCIFYLSFGRVRESTVRVVIVRCAALSRVGTLYEPPTHCKTITSISAYNVTHMNNKNTAKAYN